MSCSVVVSLKCTHVYTYNVPDSEGATGLYSNGILHVHLYLTSILKVPHTPTPQSWFWPLVQLEAYLMFNSMSYVHILVVFVCGAVHAATNGIHELREKEGGREAIECGLTSLNESHGGSLLGILLSST